MIRTMQEWNMPGQSSEQPTLFEVSDLPGAEGGAKAPSPTHEVPSRLLEPAVRCPCASGPGRAEAEAFRAVSPLANMPLHEVCAFCGNEVRAPGFVIPDYEELGAFCNEECGDKRFRLYLGETSASPGSPEEC